MIKEQVEFEKGYAHNAEKFRVYQLKESEAYQALKKQFQKETGDKGSVDEDWLLKHAAKNPKLRPLYKKCKKYTSIKENYKSLLSNYIRKFIKKYDFQTYLTCVKTYFKKEGIR
ncbi:MAG: hypothetical protein NC310_08020 [Roseburia sp.]|nr:hypothetical protein [Roseburia sp.]